MRELFPENYRTKARPKTVSQLPELHIEDLERGKTPQE